MYLLFIDLYLGKSHWDHRSIVGEAWAWRQHTVHLFTILCKEFIIVYYDEFFFSLCKVTAKHLLGVGRLQQNRRNWRTSKQLNYQLFNGSFSKSLLTLSSFWWWISPSQGPKTPNSNLGILEQIFVVNTCLMWVKPEEFHILPSSFWPLYALQQQWQ